jgi:hypothetical protein
MAHENVSFGSKAAEMIASIRQAMSALPDRFGHDVPAGVVASPDPSLGSTGRDAKNGADGERPS